MAVHASNNPFSCASAQVDGEALDNLIEETVAEQGNQAYTQKGGYPGTTADLKTELQDQIYSINFESVQSYDTLADLQAVTPIPANNTTAKVAKDTANPENNGNWYVSGGVWVQFDQTVENTVEETNTSKGVTGKAVFDSNIDTRKDLNGDLFISGGYIKSVDGEVQSSASRVYTDFLDISNSDKIILKGWSNNSTVALISYYDINQNFISSSVQNGSDLVEISSSSYPSGAVFCRCSGEGFGNDYVIYQDISSLNDLLKANKNSIINLEDELQEVIDTQVTLQAGKNLLNLNDDDYYPDGLVRNDGTTSDNATYNASGYIKVNEGDNIVVSSDGTLDKRQMRYVASYDIDKNILPTKGAIQVNDFLVLSEVAFIRVTIASSLSSVQIEKNTTPTFYSDFELILNNDYIENESIGLDKIKPEYKTITETVGDETIITFIPEYSFEGVPTSYYGHGNKYNFTGNTSFNAIKLTPYQNVPDLFLTICNGSGVVQQEFPLNTNLFNENIGNEITLLIGQTIELLANTDYVIGFSSSAILGYYGVSTADTYNVPKGRWRVSATGDWFSVSGTDNANIVLNLLMSTGESVEGFKTVLSRNQVLEQNLSLELQNKINSVSKYIPDVVLPSEIYVAVGRTIELYNSQVILTNNINNYSVQWAGLGKSRQRKWTYTGVTEDIGSTILTLKIFDETLTLLKEQQTTLIVGTDVISTPFKVLPIGASYVSDKAWLPEIANVLSNGNIDFVGTRYLNTTIGSNITHEGRPGAQASTYLAEMDYTYETTQEVGIDGKLATQNPFWNPTTNDFDLNYYRTNYNKSFDCIFTLLGSDYSWTDTTPAFTQILINKIRVTDPTIPIFLGFSLLRGSQDGLTNQTSNEGFQASPELKLDSDIKAFAMYQSLMEIASNDANIFIVPLAQMHDNQYNMGEVSVAPNPRATQTIIEPAEAVHPTTQGYLQFADVIFSALACNQNII